MTVLFFVAVVGLLLSVMVTLFTSHSSFVHTVNSEVGPGTYAKTVAAGAKGGLYPDHGGYSTSATIGCCYYAFLVLIYVFWGTYMSAEFKGAGQRRRQLIAMNSTGLWCFVSLVVLIFSSPMSSATTSSSRPWPETSAGLAMARSALPGTSTSPPSSRRAACSS